MPTVRRASVWGLPVTLWLLAAALLCLALGGDAARQALRYDRLAIADGQLWRIWTAHFVHLGWQHASLNLLGLLLCGWLTPAAALRGLWRQALWLALGVGLCLWAFSPEVPNYVGFSGVLYGLFVWSLAPQAWRGDRFAGLALLLVLGWMLWQWLGEPLRAEQQWIGGSVIGVAHVYGFVLAALAWRLMAWRARV